jgi:hypothetical protein
VAEIVMETLLHEIASMSVKRLTGRGKYFIYDWRSELVRGRMYCSALKSVCAFLTALLTLTTSNRVIAASTLPLQRHLGRGRRNGGDVCHFCCGLLTHVINRSASV